MELDKWNIVRLLDTSFLAKVKTVCVFGTLGNEALFVTKQDEVFAMGSNKSGCLGLGHFESTLNPKKVEALSGRKVVGFSYGSGPHVAAFTESGDLYIWGHNGSYELGNGSNTNVSTPTQININLPETGIIDVACGSYHTLAITSGGEVLAWGNNSSGQADPGLSNNQNCSPRRVCVAGGKRVVSIACRQTSSFAVLENGEVYAWGSNESGQLGVGNPGRPASPMKVHGLKYVFIVKVACGSSHTLALSDKGTLFTWGDNSHGQLATGNKSNLIVPIAITADIGSIVEIAATHYSHISAAMTHSGIAYMWGQYRGQTVCVPTPTPYKSLHDVFACCATPSVTWRPMTMKSDQGMSLADSLRMAFDDKKTSDLTIIVENKPIHVHKAILKIRCEHFTSMFQDHWDANSQSVIEMSEYSYPVYRAFLQFLYTDQVDLPPENAIRLFDLANSYCESQLKKCCEQIIMLGINVENAAMLYSAAIAYQAQDLEEFCFKFVMNHMTGVVLSKGFTELDDSISIDLLLKAAKYGAFKT